MDRRHEHDLFTHDSDSDDVTAFPFHDTTADEFDLELGGTIQPRALALSPSQSELSSRPPPPPSVRPRDMSIDDHAAFRRDSINDCILSPSLTESRWGNDTRRNSLASTAPFRNDMNASAFRSPISGAVSSTLSPTMQNNVAGWHLDTSNTTTASPLSLEHFPVTSAETHRYVNEPTAASPRRMSAPVPLSDVDFEDHQLHSPESPSAHPDWMDMVARESHRSTLPRHLRPGDRPQRPAPSRAASDGVRKKNARIDIPSDRHLGNIDELIEHAEDEDEIKELKGQRRLLRNREAALASRQRKKQHTEALEFKEQNYIKQINVLQAQVEELAITNSRMSTDFQMQHHKYAEVCHAVEVYEIEKQELIMSHAQETGKLRRQIQFLSEQLDNSNAHTDSTTTAHENLHAFTSDMNALSVDNQAYNMQSVSAPPTMSFGQFATAPQAAAQTVKPVSRQTDPPIASGVLFMILLCGAFVASKTTSQNAIPQMPEEVRIASTTVLDTLLADSTVDTINHEQPVPQMMAPHSATHQISHEHGMWDRMNQHDGRQSLFRSLTMPTGQPTPDHFFNLSPAEYQSLTSPEGYANNLPQATATPRRNLADALAGIRHESIAKANPAEVYSRSLLWDQIPVDVVKRFKELVKDSSNPEHTLKHEIDDTPMWAFSMGAQTGYDAHGHHA